MGAAELLEQARELIEQANAEAQPVRLPCGSRALAFAVEAGLPPRMAYTVGETARYVGVDVKTLYAEHKAGRLEFLLPKGCSKGNRILVDEVDRWLSGR